MLINLASQYAPWLPSRLFANGQQGVWYVPQPVYRGQQALFQDAAGTTPVVDDGDPVGLMLDLSPNGNHATQSVSAARPLYRTDGTLHWLEFDGVDDYLIIPDTLDAGLSPLFTVASIQAMSGAANSNALLALGAVATIGGTWRVTNEYGIRVSGGREIYDQQASTEVPEVSASVFPGAGASVTEADFYLNGSPLGVSSSGGQSVDIAPGGAVGADRDGGAESLMGFYGAAILLDSVGSSERQSSESYFSKLAGITL